MTERDKGRDRKKRKNKRGDKEKKLLLKWISGLFLEVRGKRRKMAILHQIIPFSGERERESGAKQNSAKMQNYRLERNR